MKFADRRAAGRDLADKLNYLKDQNCFVLALPRGGLPVGFEIAQTLKIPLSVIVARKIGAPTNPEFGIGAISEKSVEILERDIIEKLGISWNEINLRVKQERKELKRRINLYRGGKPLPNLKGKKIILVDDGLATGVTAQAACLALKKLNPDKIIFAAPVCASDSIEKIKSLVDEAVCLVNVSELLAIGMWYQNFEQVSDRAVINILKKAKDIASH